MVAFANFKKIAFPSSMPDMNTQDGRKEYDTRGESVQSREGTLKGRKSEEPPENFPYKKLIDNSNHNPTISGTQSPNFHNNNHKLFGTERLSSSNKNNSFKNKYKVTGSKNEASESKPPSSGVNNQNIMKVGNLFMFNIFKNNDGSATPSVGVEKLHNNQARMTPVSNIELDPIDTGMGDHNDIPNEGTTGFETRLRETQRISPTPDMNYNALSRKSAKNGDNFMDQMHKRIIKHEKHSKKLSAKMTPGGLIKKSKPSPHRTKHKYLQ